MSLTLLRMIKISVISAMVAACAFLYLWRSVARDVRSLPSNLNDVSENHSTVSDAFGAQLINFASVNHRWLPLEEIPESVVDAFLAVEDCGFYNHWGVRPTSILRAVWVNTKKGEISQGASTITQQLARMKFLGREKTIARKLKELILALRLEQTYSKDLILEAYLNSVFLGNHSYGVAAAARNYFAKDIADLNQAEAAMLAGLPRAPSFYAPNKHWTRAKKRQSEVLRRMVACKKATKDEVRSAYRQPLKVEAHIADQKPQGQKYFEAALREDLERRFGRTDIDQAGLRIQTSFDGRLSEGIDRAIERFHVGLAKFAPEMQVAYVAMNPQTGGVIGLRGGLEFATSQFDRARYMRRELGYSTLPLLYGVSAAHDYRTLPAADRQGTMSISSLLGESASNQFSSLVQGLGLGTIRQFLTATPLRLNSSDARAITGSPWELAETVASVANLGSVCEPALFTQLDRIKRQMVIKNIHCTPSKAFDRFAAYAANYLAQPKVLATDEPIVSLATMLEDRQDAWAVLFSRKVALVVWAGLERGRGRLGPAEAAVAVPLNLLKRDLEHELTRHGYWGAGTGVVPPAGIAFKMQSLLGQGTRAALALPHNPYVRPRSTIKY